MWQEEREVALGLRKVRATQSLQLGGYSIDGCRPSADFVWVCLVAWWRAPARAETRNGRLLSQLFPLCFAET